MKPTTPSTLFMVGAFLACPSLWGAAPYAHTQTPGPVSAATATLHGMVTPNGEPTTAWFEWGVDPNYGQTTAPVEVGSGTGVVRLSTQIAGDLFAGLWHCRVVSSNASGIVFGQDQLLLGGGRLVWWGTATRSWQTDLPAGLNEVLSSAVTRDFGLALRLDGRVTAWGGPTYTNVPPDLSPATAVAGYQSRALGLRADGRVFAWPSTAGLPPDLNRVVALAAGISHCLALRDDGTVIGWGDPLVTSQIPGDLANVVAIAAGNSHSLALRHDGTVVAWGSNVSGQSTVPENLGRVVAIAGGASHSLAILADGSVVGWGSNTDGERVPPAGLNDAVAVAAGQGFSVAITRSGSVVTWGSNASGQTTLPEDLKTAGSITCHNALAFAVTTLLPESAVPLATTQAPGPVTPHSALLHGMATPRGTSAAWFEWGPPNNLISQSPEIHLDPATDVVRVSETIDGLEPGGQYEFRLVVSNRFGVTPGLVRRFTTGGRISTWGRSWYGPVLPPPDLRDLVTAAAGDYHGLAIRNDGRLVTCGYYYGGLPVEAPTDVAPFVAVAGGRGHSLAVTVDGRVRAWGDNSQGQTNVPEGLQEIIAVSAGDSHSLALRRNGTVVAWGSLSTVPAGLRNVVAIASGDLHNLALRNDGVVVFWGANYNTPPPPPAGLGFVTDMAAGWLHNAVLQADGQVKVWHLHADPIITNVPSELGTVLALAAGDAHTLALQTDGTVRAWGYSDYGSTNVPTGLQNVVAIASGDQFCLALGHNTPPQANPRTVSAGADSATTISLPIADPNGDLLTFIVTMLPTRGTLHQYTEAGPGEAISAAGQLLTDPKGLVIFVPRSAEFGMAYDSFAVLANDGEFDSPEALITVNVVPVPEIDPASVTALPPAGIKFSFTGLPEATYYVQRSTDLRNWVNHPVTQPIPGQFGFEYQGTANETRAFFRVRVP
jgi:alpha-tubulin suppressor-like RCC1 family protein